MSTFDSIVEPVVLTLSTLETLWQYYRSNRLKKLFQRKGTVVWRNFQVVYYYPECEYKISQPGYHLVRGEPGVWCDQRDFVLEDYALAGLKTGFKRLTVGRSRQNRELLKIAVDWDQFRELAQTVVEVREKGGVLTGTRWFRQKIGLRVDPPPLLPTEVEDLIEQVVQSEQSVLEMLN